MKSSKPTIEKETWGDIVERELGEPPEGIIIYSYEGEDDFDDFDSDDRCSERNSYPRENSKEKDYSDNHTSECIKDVRFSASEQQTPTNQRVSRENVKQQAVTKECDQEASLEKQSCRKETPVSKPPLVPEKETIPETQETQDQQEKEQPVEYLSNKKIIVPLDNWFESESESESESKIVQTPYILFDPSFNQLSAIYPPGYFDYYEKKAQKAASKKGKKKEEVIEEVKVSETLQNGDEQKPSKKPKRKKKQKTSSETASGPETIKDQEVSGENTEQEEVSVQENEGDQAASLEKQTCTKETPIFAPSLVPEKEMIPEKQDNTEQEEVSTPEIVKDQSVSFQNEICTNETVISKSQEVVEEIKISETLQNGEEQGEKKPSKKSKRKNKQKTSLETASGPETLKDQEVSGENTEQEEVSTPEIVKDQSVSFQNEICRNETVISKPQEVVEEVKVSETLQNGEEQGEKKPSKKSKRKKKQKTSLETASGPETLKDQEVSGENTEQEEVSTPEIVKDQSVSFQNEICTNETVISKPQEVVEEVKVSETLQNGEEQGEKKPSKKSKRKKKQKTSLETASGLETLKDQEVSGENAEQEEVSVLEKEGVQAASLEKQTYTKETPISTPPLVPEKETIPETQDILDQHSENIQVENLTEVSDNQTSGSTQEERFTQASDNQRSEVAEIHPTIQQDTKDWTHTYRSAAFRTRQDNRRWYCYEYSVPPYPNPYTIRSERRAQKGKENPLFGLGEVQERFLQMFHNSQNPAPMPYPRPPPEVLTPEMVSGENTEQEEVSVLGKEGFQAASLEKQTNTKETPISTPPLVPEKETIPETQDILDQHSENIQVENLTEVSDNQTSGSTQDERFTQASDNQRSEVAVIHPTIQQDIKDWTRTYKSAAFRTRQDNRRWYCYEYSVPPYPNPYTIRSERRAQKGKENPQFGLGEVQENFLQMFHNSQNPAPMPYPRPPPPPPYLRQMYDLQQHLKYMEDVFINCLFLSNQADRRLWAEKKYNDCLTQLHFYEGILKDSKESPYLPKFPEVPKNGEKCKCQAKLEKIQLENMEIQEYLMKQANEMYHATLLLNAELNHKEELLKKKDSEQRQDKKQTVSVEIQTDSREASELKATSYQTISTQTEVDVQETKCEIIPVFQTISTQTEVDVQETKCEEIPVYQNISTQTEVDVQETRCEKIPVYQTISTQTEVDVQETNCEIIPVYQTISTQTETVLLLNVEEVKVSETLQNGEEQGEKKPSKNETLQNGEEQGEKKPSKKSKRKKKQKTFLETASGPETLNDQEVSGENIEHEEVSTPEIVKDQSVSLQNETCTNETVISKPQEVVEEVKVSETIQNGEEQGEKKPSKKSKRKKKQKTSLETASGPETLKDQEVSGENTEQEEVSTPEIVMDQSVSLQNEICTNETVISKPQEVVEEVKVSETLQNGDEQGEKKPSKKSKRKKKQKTSLETASVPETLNDQEVSGENIEQEEVSTPEIVKDQSVSLQNEICTNETVISKPQEVVEEVKVSETIQNGEEQGEKKPSKKSKRKKKQKTSLETASGPETLKDQEVSGENTEQEEVSTPEIVKDQSVSLQNEICTNETVISKPQEVVEEVKVSETLQNGEEQGEKKPSKKSKRKKKQKTSLETASGLETLKDQEVSGENAEQEEVSTPEIVKDQPVSLQNEICIIAKVISKPQEVVEEVKVSETLQNGEEQGEKKPSKKSKRKKKQKTSLETASGPETLNDQEVSGENIEQEKVSTPEIVKDQSVSLQNEICTNETVISKPEEVVEEVKVSETLQNGEEQGEKKPSKKSKKSVFSLSASAKRESGQKEKQTSKALKVSEREKASKFQKKSIQKEETKSKKSQHAVTSPPQMKIKEVEDAIHTQAAKEGLVQDNNPKQADSLVKKVSLWKRIKKAMTPSNWCRCKDRKENQPQ
ncbi:uncharacterized protein LOC118565340 isoform X3 [Fundulus heteroclitus]|uniref:uncharacterized protein LOC118565340 isoform X3 n=1 Tax=Fundulus heteroclitus TaxID=8078 RepID=UPI00165A5268|nr:uncharacterized protein LOC118565340 isoform X3 [Fundulus heteroclitus]